MGFVDLLERYKSGQSCHTVDKYFSMMLDVNINTLGTINDSLLFSQFKIFQCSKNIKVSASL